MSDLGILGGALGIGANPSYDPKEARGYLDTLDTQAGKLDKSYNDVVGQRRAKVKQMQSIVDDATKTLLEARQTRLGAMNQVVGDAERGFAQNREGRINLPMLAAGSAMMMPSSTGGLGASLGAAGLTAAPYVAADRRGADENTQRIANLKMLPLGLDESIYKDAANMRLLPMSIDEGIDKDVAGQLSTRINTNEQQRGAVTRGVLTANTTGMKQVQKELGDIRKQAAQEAKNQMAAALRGGATYDGDDAMVEQQLTEALYAKLFHDRYGVWPGQATAGKDMTPAEIEKGVPKMPRSIPKETKQERDTYTSISNLGGTAEKNLSALEFAESPNPVPGMLSGPALWASRLAEAVGMGGEWGKAIGDAGTDVGKMQAVMRDFVLSMQKDQKGVQTEGDAKRMSEAIANTTNTAQLNKLMFGWMRSQALAAKWQADVADDFVKGNKNRASGINAHMNDKGRTALVRPGPNNAKVTLWDYVSAYVQQNPGMKRDEAERKAVEMWNSL